MTLNNKIDAVCPLLLKDIERFKMLHTSMKTFFNDLSTCWIITKDDEFKKISQLITDPQFCILRETELIPELKFKIRFHNRKWYKQQLIKLGIANRVKTAFYLTLDADIILTKNLKASDLITNNRAICCTDTTNLHPLWYTNAERVLKLKRRTWVSHHVTPVILNREAVLKMQQYIEGIAPFWYTKNRALRQWITGFMRRPNFKTWTYYLLRQIPWTEYSLYYTYLEATDQFEQYHYYAKDQGSLYSTHSLWFKEQIASWTPEAAFQADDPSFFIVIQSNTHLNPKLIHKHLNTYISHENIIKKTAADGCQSDPN